MIAIAIFFFTSANAQENETISILQPSKAHTPAFNNLSIEEKNFLSKLQTLKIGISPDWPPFEFLDEKGVYTGISADYFKLATEMLGLKFEIPDPYDSWDTVINKIKNQQLDGAASIFISEDRKGFIEFTAPYAEIPHVIITNKNSPKYSKMEELFGKKVAYLKGWLGQKIIETDFPQINLTLNDRTEGLIGQVLLGTSDAGLIDMASLAYYSKKHNLSELRIAFSAPFKIEMAMGFRKDLAPLAKIFDKAIKLAPPQKIAKIHEKWLKTIDSSAETIENAQKGIVILFGIVSLALFWNFQLRRQVKLRTTELEKEIDLNKRQKLALEESSEKLKALFDQSFQLTGILTKTGEIIEANSPALDLIGASKEEVVGKPFWETPWWNHSANLQEQIKHGIKSAASGKFIRFEAASNNTDKNQIIDFSLKPFKDNFGAIKYLIAEGRDITDLHMSLQALRESEERFRILFDNSPDPSWIIKNGLFEDCNLSAIRALKYGSKEELVSIHPSKISPEFQPDGLNSRQKADEFMRQALIQGVLRFEWTHLRKDETELPVEVTLASLTLHGESAIFCQWRDISEKIKAEESRKKLEAQFLQAQKMESVGRLAGGIAHDFNNLLTVINGFTELLLLNPQMTSDMAKMLQEVAKAGKSASSLTRQLLAFSRKDIVEHTTIDLAFLLKNLKIMLDRVIGEDINLKLKIAENLYPIKADTGQLEQVFVNMAVNARDAMTDGGKLIIEASNVNLDSSLSELTQGLKEGRYVNIAISDTGSGMSEEVRQHIFEPFFTTKEVGKGTGLGMAMVYGVINQLGGVIQVYSELGTGTTFKILIPASNELLKNPLENEKYQSKGNGELIMVVEDEDSLRGLVKEGLTMFNYRVIDFPNGKEALIWLQNSLETEEMPSLLLTDVVMPGINGRELSEKVHELLPELPTIFSSGFTEDAILTRGILDTEVEFISKPYSLQNLSTKISKVLNSKK